MKTYTTFSARPKSKLKFNPAEGVDVKLPQPNPVTQYLPTEVQEWMPGGRESAPLLTTTGNKGLWTGAQVKNSPSTSSIMGGVTPVPQSPRIEPQDSEIGSVPVTEKGMDTPEKSTLKTPMGECGDMRKGLDSRAIMKGSKDRKEAVGLLNRDPSKNYYRKMLNAL
jgi:hypothetical protein